jgi:tetratricopeptide (TPR) repeat protein/energy-coupling factor transporter ATP-binding protein EcfA2
MLDPISALLLFVLFRATEAAIGFVGEKIADAIGKPIWEALGNQTQWLAGKDETSARWRGFSEAFVQARVGFVEAAPNREAAQRVAGLLAKFDLKPGADREWLERLAPELEKASLLSEKPDVDAITRLLMMAFERQDQPPPSRADAADAVAVFVPAFQDRLFTQPAYQELMLKRAWWDQLRKPRYDTRERYLEQLIDRHQNLEFAGIPELKDRQGLRIEDVFINLRAEIEVETERGGIVARIAPGEGFAEQLSEAADRLTGYPREKMKRRLSVNEALRENTRLVVLGDPGAGKTTLLKYVALAFAERRSDRLGLDEDRLPIFVRLYDYAAKQAERQGDYSLIDYLHTQARENLLLMLEPGFFESELERGQCCVCLDGLDELGGAGLRREVTAAVAALANKYPRNRYLVTSRLVGYEEAPLDRRDFVHHTVLPFGDDDIRAFVQKWYAAREKDPLAARERTAHLINTIMAEERIKTLAANPLLLTIIALVHRIEAELPHERVKLYDKCVTALVETWDKVRGVTVEDRQRPYYKYRRRLLEQLAYWMHAQPRTTDRAREVKEGDLELQLTRCLLDNPKLQLDDEAARQEAQDFIHLAKGRTGLLVERGDRVYTFAHLTFQEYLAASDTEHRLAHSIDALWKEIRPRLHDPHWHEVILLLLGSLNKFEKHPTELVRRIFKSRDKYEGTLHRRLFLAARALADRVEVDAALHDAIVDGLLAVARSDRFARDDALAALGSLQGDARAAQSLLALARDGQVGKWVRSDAASALGELGRADEAADVLLALARDAQVDAEERSYAAFILGKLGRTDEAVDVLLALVRDAQVDAGTRSYAAFVLGELGRADEAVEVLLALARDAQVDVEARSYAVSALKELGRANEAVDVLLALVRDAQVHALVRSHALSALGHLGHANEAVEVLLALARDAQVHAWVWRESTSALGELGRADEAVEVLLALARDAQVDAEVRYNAASALGALGRADEAVEVLLVLARDARVDSGVRCNAASALGEFGRANEAAEVLLALARDAQVDAGVRRAAYSSLKALLGGGQENEA